MGKGPMMNRRALMIGAPIAAGAAACSRSLSAYATPPDAIAIVAPPNPHTFPLLLAMARDPALPVRLIPVAESRDADAQLARGDAAGLLAMSYIAAKKRMSGAAPDLRMHSIFFWRGFFQVAGEDVRSFADLRGRTVIVSGPIGSGRGGGGDVIFQAAARRQGVDPATELDVQYMPVAEGVERVARGDGAAITLPSPGSTGLVMRALMARRPMMAAMARSRGMTPGPSVPLAAHIDLQRLFSGFSSFPADQLPLGGLAVTERAMAHGPTRAKIDRIASAYGDAAALLMRDPGAHAEQASALFSHYYTPLGAGGPPAMLLARAVEAGDLVYRSDVAVDHVRADLERWLGELIGEGLDSAFFERG